MLTNYKVKTIIYPHGQYWLGKAAPVIDEGAFYRINESHIIDKDEIIKIDQDDKKISLTMKSRNVVLIVE